MTDPEHPDQPPKFEKFDPDWTIRPGAILAEEIEAAGFRSLDFPAKVSGLHPDVIAGVLDGSIEITPNIAEGLARIGGTARLWLALEQTYRRGLALGRKDISDD